MLDSLLYSVLQTKKDGLCVRALAVITPGNPTGQVIPKENIEQLLKFAKDNDLSVIADEVYQVNVYNSKMQFDSFKKTIRNLGSDYNDVPLFSLQSISKGYYGTALLPAVLLYVSVLNQRCAVFITLNAYNQAVSDGDQTPPMCPCALLDSTSARRHLARPCSLQTGDATRPCSSSLLAFAVHQALQYIL